MSILNFIVLTVAAAIAVAAVGVAIYKWLWNTKADFSPRENEKKSN